MLGNLYAFVMIGGTSSTDPDSIAPRWRADPYNTFVPEFIKARSWADLNGQPIYLCLYQPCGYPRTGVMPLDAYMKMRARDAFFADEILRIIRDFAPQCKDFLVYTGSPTCKPDSEWTIRDLRLNIAPYAMQGMTSIAFDQSSKLNVEIWEEVFDRCDVVFQNVLLEGQYPAESAWKLLYHNIITAAWNPSNPSLYAPIGRGDFVLVGNVPPSMADANSAEKRAWKRSVAGRWLKAGVHVVIDIDDLEGATLAELTA